MLTPASFAGPAQPPSNNPYLVVEDDGVSPAAVQHVRYARLPCRRVPGPPLFSSKPPASPEAQLHADPSSACIDATAPVTRSFAGPSAASPTSAAPAVSASSGATDAAGGALSPASLNAPAEVTETPFQAAQQFLASSGASLLYFTNPAFFLTVRHAIENGSSSHGDTAAEEELSEEAQSNLLASQAATLALKERYNGYNSTSGGSGTAGTAVDWKKLAWVRQQCRYTGEAIVTSPPSLVPSATTPAGDAGRSSAAAAASASPTEPQAEKSVGARFMQSLLHPFIPSVAAVPGSAASSKKLTEKQQSSSSVVVPHGNGAMTYILYAAPKQEHSAAVLTAQPPNTCGGEAEPLYMPCPPFLNPQLIPSACCPPLEELDDGVEGAATARPPAVSEATASPPLTRLLLALVVYEGSFQHGRRHGRGRLTAYGRVVLECAWVHDVPLLEMPQDWSPSLSSPPALLAPPTLRRIHAHVCASSIPSHKSHVSTSSTGPEKTAAPHATSSTSGRAPPLRSIRSTQLYMGSLALTTVATKRLMDKLTGPAVTALASTAASTAGSVVATAATLDVHGARYVRLAVPPVVSSSSASAAAVPLAAAHAFGGLAWVNHVVLLPDGFGEAHYYATKDENNAHPSSSPGVASLLLRRATTPPTQQAAALSVTVADHFHPPLWVPSSARAPRLPCTQYCGEWVAGQPHGFGVELERITDPTGASLALSSVTASAGPPQYPWRTLFLGAYARGERRGPGTYHGTQGSDATEVVLCGTWPRDPTTQASVNVVLLPGSSGNTVGYGAASFFTLQGAPWTDNSDADSHMALHGSSIGGGGAFQSATLRQFPAALSGMWEPLFSAVDELVAQPTLPLALHAGTSATHHTSHASPALLQQEVVWEQTCEVMDRLTQSSQCRSALSAFRRCFACIYGADTAAAGLQRERQRAAEEEVRLEDSITTSSSSGSGSGDASRGGGAAPGVPAFLDRLSRAAAAVSGASADAAIAYPWCPSHSWCGMAGLGAATTPPHGSAAETTSPSGLTAPPTKHVAPMQYCACLHDELPAGVTHHPTHLAGVQGAQRIGSTIGPSGRVRRPPLSAVAAAMEPFAAAHTFTHAMHAAAAMVSSLRLRLLSCFAAYPDLCEVVMGRAAGEDCVLQYCWDLVFQCVGSILCEKATAVAVADVQMVWDLLGLDRVCVSAAARGDGPTVVAPAGWQPEGKETLRDYFVAMRRCRSEQRSDVLAGCASESSVLDDSAWQRWLRDLEVCLQGPSWTGASTPSSSSVGRRSGGLHLAIQTLQSMHRLSRAAPTSMDDDENAADGARLASAHSQAPSEQEALHRWLLLAASDAASHQHPTSPSRPPRGPATTGHPFALLLVAQFVLGGRVTPSYPAAVATAGAVKSTSADPAAAASCVLRTVRELGYAARQLLHTYPSICAYRSDNRRSSSCRSDHRLLCPVDVLWWRLEYALSPCATQFLFEAASMLEMSSVLLASLAARATVRNSEDAEPSTDGDGGGLVGVAADQLPHRVHCWCADELTGALSEAVMQTRLQRYWSRLCTPTHAQSDETDGMQAEVKSALSLLPSPLVQWVLMCLQSIFSAPLQRAATSAALDSTVHGAAEVDGGVVRSPAESLQTHTWTKFINAVFFTPAEKAEWTDATASSSALPILPLSLHDYCYLIALAHTLREVAHLDLSFTAQFVRDAEDEGEEGDVGGLDTADDVALSGSADDAQSRSVKAQLQRDRKRNIFLSSSSSSSSDASSVSLSAASSPPPQQQQQQELEPADFSTSPQPRLLDEEAVSATTASTLTATNRAAFFTPASSLVNSAGASTARSSPRGGAGRRSRAFGEGRSRSALLLSGDGVKQLPLGKEWRLTVSMCQHNNCDSGSAWQQPCKRPAASAGTLLWEVMEQCCTSVLHRLQVKDTSMHPMESDLAALKANRM